jgi:DNA-binding NarL/FixJ family response regulator
MPWGSFVFVIIDRRTLIREALQTALAGTATVAAYPDPEAWSATAGDPPHLIVLGIGTDPLDAWRASLQSLTQKAPVMLISDLPDAEQITAALGLGVRGYLGSDESFCVLRSAIALILAGGSFVSADQLRAARKRHEAPAHSFGLSARQTQIAEGIRVGKPNKILAYELGMQESTVKVHIRNIMRKMRARNRTEIAFLLSQQRGDYRRAA